MSTKLKIAAVAALTLAATATSAHAQSRYGDIQSYEGAADCAPSACAPAAPVASSRYGTAPAAAPVAGYGAPVVVDCSVFGTPGCGPQVVAQPTTVYTQPAPTYAQAQPTVEIYNDGYSSGTSYQAGPPANCPAGTTAQADGTCMQGSSSSTYSSGSTSYSSGSTYSAPTTMMSEPANCPAGTTAQADGTCMQGSSYSAGSSYSSGSTYSSPSVMMAEPVNCPAGTTAQADGTCAQTSTSYASPSTVYTGDATASYGYGADGSYGADAYRPIRK